MNYSATTTDSFNDTNTSHHHLLHSQFNATFSSHDLRPGRDESLAKVEVAVQTLIFVVTVCGNGVVLAALMLRRRHHLSRMNIMMVHLACADLFVAFFNTLPQLSWDITYLFQGGDVLCRSVKYLQVVAMYASSYVLVSTAIDRWLAICHPLTTHVAWSMTKTHTLVAVAWTLALLFAIPQIFIFRWTLTSRGVHDCWGDFDSFAWSMPAYVTAVTFAIYIIPTIILVAAYTSICCAVWRSVQGRNTPSAAATGRRGPDGRPMLSSASTVVIVVAAPGGGTTSNGPSSQMLLARTSSGSSQDKLNTGSNGQVLGNGRTPSYRSNAATGAEARATSSLARSNYYRSSVSSARSGPPVSFSPLPPSSSRPLASTLSRAKVKTVKLTLTVVICYLVCWGPFFVVQMWQAWDPSFPYSHSAIAILMLLASLNSCANPWIFFAFSGIDMFDDCCRFVPTSSRSMGGFGGTGDRSTAAGAGGGGMTADDIALKTRLTSASAPPTTPPLTLDANGGACVANGTGHASFTHRTTSAEEEEEKDTVYIERS